MMKHTKTLMRSGTHLSLVCETKYSYVYGVLLHISNTCTYFNKEFIHICEEYSNRLLTFD